MANTNTKIIKSMFQLHLLFGEQVQFSGTHACHHVPARDTPDFKSVVRSNEVQMYCVISGF